MLAWLGEELSVSECREAASLRMARLPVYKNVWVLLVGIYGPCMGLVLSAIRGPERL